MNLQWQIQQNKSENTILFTYTIPSDQFPLFQNKELFIASILSRIRDIYVYDDYFFPPYLYQVQPKGNDIIISLLYPTQDLYRLYPKEENTIIEPINQKEDKQIFNIKEIKELKDSLENFYPSGYIFIKKHHDQILFRFIPSISFILFLYKYSKKEAKFISYIYENQKDNKNQIQNNYSFASILQLLTKAIEIRLDSNLYKYEIDEKEQEPSSYLQLKVEYFTKDDDPIFGKFIPNTIQELWEELTASTIVKPELYFISKKKFNRLNFRNINEMIKLPRKDWIETDLHHDLIRIEAEKNEIPKKGFFILVDLGNTILSTRLMKLEKGYLSKFNLYRLLNMFPKNHHLSSQEENDVLQISRQELPAKIVETPGIFMVQGPPGTGKTYLASEVIIETLKRNPKSKILVVAKDHIAVNHLLEKSTEMLKKHKINFWAVRLDSTNAKKEEFAQEYSISWQIENIINACQWKENFQNWETTYNPNQTNYDLRKKKLIIESANIIYTTSTDAAFDDLLEDVIFDRVIIEEASKLYPNEIFHCIAKGIQILLIGDHRQLPPFKHHIIKKNIQCLQEYFKKPYPLPDNYRFKKYIEEIKKIIKKEHSIDPTSLWEQVIDYSFFFKSWFKKAKNKYTLNEEYRMEKSLTEIIFKTFYKSDIKELQYKKKKSSLYQDKLSKLPEPFSSQLLWITTEHMTKNPQCSEDKEERFNLYEIVILVEYLKIFQQYGLINLDSFAILTPYNQQREYMLDHTELAYLIEYISGKEAKEVIKTVDSFQGKEAEIVIVSLVRNNDLEPQKSWGFVSLPERLNVMFSRAKYSLTIIGCIEHILRNYFRDNGENKYLGKFYYHFKKSGGTIIKAKEHFDIKLKKEVL